MGACVCRSAAAEGGGDDARGRAHALRAAGEGGSGGVAAKKEAERQEKRVRRDSAGSASSEDDEDDEQGAAGSADVFATSDLSLLVNTKDCKELHDQLRELPLLCTSVLKMDQLVTMFAENDRGGKGVVDTNDVERIVDQIVAGIVVMLPALVRKFYRPPKSSVRSLDLLTVQADGMRKLAASDQLLLHKQAAFARVLTDDGMGGGTASKAAFVDRFPSALQAYLAAFIETICAPPLQHAAVSAATGAATEPAPYDGVTTSGQVAPPPSAPVR